MTHRSTPGPVTLQLARSLVDRAPDEPLTDELTGWLASSHRYRAFVEEHASKSRKKLRGATDVEARRDVRTELVVAHVLLSDRRIDLSYEAYGSGKAGPDFTVAVRGQRAFNLEMTRLRSEAATERFWRPLLAKLRQLPPSAPNALLVAVPGDTTAVLDVSGTVHSLRTRADRKDEEFFTSRGFDGTRGFYERYLRLGGVLTWCEGAAGDACAAWWRDSSARISVPERAISACLACLRAGIKG